jgi:Family of unknown function (DUF5803)
MHKFTSALIAQSIIVLVITFTGISSDFNGTTYYLHDAKVEVVQPINASKFELVLPEKAENFALNDSFGKRIELNSSYAFWRGEYTYTLYFGQHVLGNLSYSTPHQGQQFFLILKQDGPVRIVLPDGYATGDRLLGIARPIPYDAGIYASRMTLTWQNASKYQVIEVSYYEQNAPSAVRIIMAILVALAIGLLVEYYSSMRRLRAIRDDTEKKL